MMKLLLDSVILIDHFNNNDKATDYISQHHQHVGISVITRAEVLTGFPRKKELNLAKKLLDQFELYPINAAEADLAALLRKQFRLKLPDAFQAAIAKLHHLKLVTRNTKDFNPKKMSFIIIPY